MGMIVFDQTVSKLCAAGVALALAVSVAGCASSGAIDAPTPRQPIAFSRATASVRIVNAGVVTSETSAALSTAVRNALLARRAFEIVRNNGSTAPVMLQLTITGGREVDQISRIGLGAFAGTARLDVHVEVLAGGRTTDTFDVHAKSSSGTIFAGTTDQAVSIIADQIAARLAP